MSLSLALDSIRSFQHKNLQFSNPDSTAHVTITDVRTNVSYVGTTVKDVEHFQNIFYAEDTSGPNRFAPPVPRVPAPRTTIDATTPGAWCPQKLGPKVFSFMSPTTNVSENCLSLHIARSAGTATSARLPVVVWIHEGGNTLGSAYDKLNTPDGLIRQAELNGQPVVFVGINYRLGIFGYATNRALRETKQGNAGLRDQRAALDWIRYNVETFGGDPSKVTVVGDSVGASSIGLHITSYAGERGVPFQKAIMMSGGSGLNFNIMSDFVENNTAHIATSLGCNDMDPATIIACLRGVPFEQLMNKSIAFARELRPPFGEQVFYPSYDGDYIRDRPSVLLREGRFVKNIPIIGSWTTNDGAWYVPRDLADDDSVIATISGVVLGLSNPSKSRLLALYPASDFEHLVRPDESATVHYYQAAQMHRDFRYTCPVIDFTWQYARSGETSVRMYEMNQTKFEPIFKRMGVPWWRVSHLSDIPYMLNNDDQTAGDNSAAQKRLSALLSGSTAAFAHTSDPTMSDGEVLQDWPVAYDDRSKSALEKDVPEAMNVYVVGGDYGSGPASISTGENEGLSPLDAAVAWEKLLKRCGFINSILEEVGV